MCIFVYVSVVSWQAAWGKERPDGYYANEASCLLHWQTPRNSLLVLLEVRKYFIPVSLIATFSPSSSLFPQRRYFYTLHLYIHPSLHILPPFPRVCLTIHLHCYSNECTNRESFLKHLLTSGVRSKLFWRLWIHSSLKKQTNSFPWIGLMLIQIFYYCSH